MNPKNPYYVLELGADATPAEIEREGKKLLGLLAVGATRALTYTCALGTFPRDETLVRESVAILRDPGERARRGCLARLLVVAPDGRLTTEATPLDAPLPDAFALAGYPGL